MAKKILAVELPGSLYSKFIKTVTREGGPWRGRQGEDTFEEAVESAVSAALMLFLQNLDKETSLPEFRDYMHEKYPELDEYLITVFEDLIESRKVSMNS